MEENSEKSSRNKVQQSSILSFVKSKPVKSRISEDEDENSKGTQAQRQPEFRSLDDNITAIQKARDKKSRRKVDLALLLATKIRVKIIPYTQNQNYQKA